VALHEGRPFVSASGAIELWHSSCWGQPAVCGVEEVTVVTPRRRGDRRWLAAGAAAVLACVVGAAHATAPPSRHASMAIVDLEGHESVSVEAAGTTREALPTLDQTFPIPTVDGQRLDDLYPSLVDWIHPVTGAAELYPAQPSRHFGAERKGIIPFGLAEQSETLVGVRGRPECGAGHCGVDLDGPRGRAVVAVADGTVVRVERHEFGLDGRSGRYVRIEHDDGTLTAYMHLDDIVDGLEVGDHVDGGQMIGTLGATACYASAPHLHFSLEIPNHPGTHGDNTDTHYVDPAPFLMRAKVVSVPDRRHGIKPAM
jgi:murein DD-endopeptidase MepM/ murein hydrolase activator NlpD